MNAPKIAASSRHYFCPVSLGKNVSTSLWIVFGVSLAAAVFLNLTHTSSPALLGLYAVPILIFTVFVMNFYMVLLFGAGALGYWISFSDGGWLTYISAAAVLLNALLIRRVVIVSRSNFKQRSENEELFMNTILSFSKSIDARDPYTAFHSNNVAGYAQKIAMELNLSKSEVEAIHLAGLIHDIGKIGTPEHILHKESRLTEEEYDLMKKHAEDGYQIIKDIKKLQQLGVTEMVRHHHERIDGRGYPLGMKGDAIPLGARILAASDAFDAMTTNRSYRAKLSVDTAAEELRRHSGTQFDPKVAEAFLRVLNKEGMLESVHSPVGAMVLQKG